MEELIKVNYDEKSGGFTVLGRDLYDFLKVKDQYSHWMEDMIAYGFTEGIDFISFREISLKGGRPKIEHQLNLDMAKELSMLQRTERGKQARLYFIECEKMSKNPEYLLTKMSADDLVDMALRYRQQANMAESKLIMMNNFVENTAEKVQDYDYLFEYESLYNFKQVCNMYSLIAKKPIGRTTMIRMLKGINVLCVDNSPRQMYIDSGYLTTRITYINKGMFGKVPNQQTFFTNKGLIPILNLLINKNIIEKKPNLIKNQLMQVINEECGKIITNSKLRKMIS